MVPLEPHHQRIRNLPILLGIGFSALLIVLALLLDHATPASAQPADLAGAEAQYPVMVGSRIDACVFCHTSSIPNLNPFGSAYLAAGRNSAALVAIQNSDSDGDGFTNIQEINALTFPGDAADHPAVVASATPTRAPSATPLPTMTRTPTAGPTSTRTATLAATLTHTPTGVASATNTPTGVASSTSTPTGVATSTRTPTPLVSRTPSRQTRTPQPSTVCAAPRGGDDESSERSSESSDDSSERSSVSSDDSSKRSTISSDDRSSCDADDRVGNDHDDKSGSSGDRTGKGGDSVSSRSLIGDALTEWTSALATRFRHER